MEPFNFIGKENATKLFFNIFFCFSDQFQNYKELSKEWDWEISEIYSLI